MHLNPGYVGLYLLHSFLAANSYICEYLLSIVLCMIDFLSAFKSLLGSLISPPYD